MRVIEETATFSTRGQIVIPRRLRKELGIEEGTKALVCEVPEGILLRPITRKTIGRLHGILKHKPGDKTFAEEWAEHKREEGALEEAKYARHSSR